MTPEVTTLSEDDKKLRYLRMTATRANKIWQGWGKAVLKEMVEGSSFYGSDHTYMGTRLEPIILDLAQKRLGHTLRKIGTVISQELYDEEREWHWGAASGDAQFYTPSGQLINVECKTANYRKFVELWKPVDSARKWDYRLPWHGQLGGPEGVAEEYHGQLHWQHLILNAAGSIVCACVGNEVNMYRFPRDVDAEKKLIDMCYPVWKDAWDALKAQKEGE